MPYFSQANVLFGSDLFGNYDPHRRLFTQLTNSCLDCEPKAVCPPNGKRGPRKASEDFINAS